MTIYYKVNNSIDKNKYEEFISLYNDKNYNNIIELYISDNKLNKLPNKILKLDLIKFDCSFNYINSIFPTCSYIIY